MALDGPSRRKDQNEQSNGSPAGRLALWVSTWAERLDTSTLCLDEIATFSVRSATPVSVLTHVK